ncbi:hypothetical protein Nepgr_032916 [Nepenthes gracilis]|uniref:Uncharacterized protein n=1 Tax=Nepenthes gracilis TaxID=150966 RepID=A0AAD3TLB7_NEPGR|nr:hypothetical protein Nepgr_032916 [Nepenthes gracilis]
MIVLIARINGSYGVDLVNIVRVKDWSSVRCPPPARIMSGGAATDFNFHLAKLHQLAPNFLFSLSSLADLVRPSSHESHRNIVLMKNMADDASSTKGKILVPMQHLQI